MGSAARFSPAVLTAPAVCGGLVLYRSQLGALVGLGMLLLALTVLPLLRLLPLLPKATRHAEQRRETAGRTTEFAADTAARSRAL